MRLTWTIVGVALSASLTGAPAYADHGRPLVASQHAQAPKTTSTSNPTNPSTTGSTGTATTSGSTATSPTKPTTTLTPIAAKIVARPKLDARITALLPKGMSLNDASKGFKNQGQFIAALHVARNLHCNCFKQLQLDMTTKGMSLGQAIRDVRQTANATIEARKGETEADDDVKSTTRTSTKTTGTTTTGTTTTGTTATTSSTSTHKTTRKPSQNSGDR